MIAVETETITLTEEQFSVFSCISYFDVFKYPLKPAQVLEFANVKISQAHVNLVLNQLIELKLIAELNGYYFLDKSTPEYINKRSDSEKRFSKKQKIIKRFAGLVSRFPFVETVCISGSCSKGLLDEDGDVDYFIITSPNKLWLCRTLLIAFKKIFLFNSKKYFCINYLVDSNNLTIPDQNPFVAAEIKTLLPVSNKALFEQFLAANNWTGNFYPNKFNYDSSFLKEKKSKKYFFGFIEFLFSGKAGERLDKKCFEITLSSWQKKFPNFNKEDFDLNLRSRKNVSKHHPRGYQQKVLTELNTRLEKIKVLAA
ncbi:MAG: nucleotidyltransferase domain-containing protein [Bacteroidetes bacterium]|nr:nucleotidyltransferase domain-containing protein [Bacteroidota bacterium]